MESTIKKGIPYIFFITWMIFASISITAQTSHTVTVSNFSFSPNDITITAGDTVIWKNVSGTHNVNGTTVTYPSNPESFGNAVSTGWTYSHVFNISGNYDYRCDPHFASGMTGKIFVEGPATGYNTDPSKYISDNNTYIYPNPAEDYLTVDLQQSGEKFQRIRILDLVGKELLSFHNPAGSTYQKFDVSRFNPGVYLMQVETDSKTRIIKFIIR